MVTVSSIEPCRILQVVSDLDQRPWGEISYVESLRVRIMRPPFSFCDFIDLEVVAKVVDPFGVRVGLAPGSLSKFVDVNVVAQIKYLSRESFHSVHGFDPVLPLNGPKHNPSISPTCNSVIRSKTCQANPKSGNGPNFPGGSRLIEV